MSTKTMKDMTACDSGRDRVFGEPMPQPGDFKFSKEVANVFDDMVDRSVPFYAEIQRMVVEMALDFTEEDAKVVDLGCATGTTLAALAERSTHSLHLIGLDNAPEMLGRAEAKLSQFSRHRVDLRLASLGDEFEISGTRIVFLVLTLQFLRPIYRQTFLQRIYDSLEPNGCFILVEKVLGQHSLFNRLFIRYYYDMKRRAGYSDLEIAQKREALENVLVPYRLEENEALLESVGFKQQDTFFKWYNFAGIVAVK